LGFWGSSKAYWETKTIDTGYYISVYRVLYELTRGIENMAMRCLHTDRQFTEASEAQLPTHPPEESVHREVIKGIAFDSQNRLKMDECLPI
jgi:hypothetical protein